MQESDKNFDFDGGNEDLIEKLLASENPGDQSLGLRDLDAKKRERFCGLLRRLSNRNGWGLQGEDIAEIWQATMIAIWKNIERGRFEQTGALDGYVYGILRNRGIDFMRRRRVGIAINRDVDVNQADVASRDETDETQETTSEWLLLAYIKNLAESKNLSETETLAITHYVILLLANNDFPSPAELAASVNIERVSYHEPKLGLEAVRSAKARAIKKLGGKDGEQK